MRIENSITKDVHKILALYDHAIAYQSKMGAVQWPKFTSAEIKKEILSGQQWKMLIEDQIACAWMTTFDDPYIWGDKNEDPSLYIHRIATNPVFRGSHFVNHIIKWACVFAKQNQKKFIRMDTAGYNKKLIEYYTGCGFTFLGANPLADASKLPMHYQNTPVCLFEMEI